MNINGGVKLTDIEKAEIRSIYVDQERGIYFISKLLGRAQETVRVFLKREGLLKTDRQFKKIDNSFVSKRTRQHEFSVSTKRAAFEREKGICQECHQAVEGGWTQGTYHHTKPVAKGGEPTLDNCMLLHRECHEDPDVFRRLHGFDIERLHNYKIYPRQHGELRRRPCPWQKISDSEFIEERKTLTVYQIAKKYSITVAQLYRRQQRINKQ